jgi:hypothetical protein
MSEKLSFEEGGLLTSSDFLSFHRLRVGLQRILPPRPYPEVAPVAKFLGPVGLAVSAGTCVHDTVVCYEKP